MLPLPGCDGSFPLPFSRHPSLLPREFVGEKDVAQKFLAELSRRTAVMGAAWQSVGFVHGVLNTGACGRARAAAQVLSACSLRGFGRFWRSFCAAVAGNGQTE